MSLPKNRSKYMENIFDNDFNQYSSKYTKLSLVQKFKIIISICLNKTKRIIRGE